MNEVYEVCQRLKAAGFDKDCHLLIWNVDDDGNWAGNYGVSQEYAELYPSVYPLSEGIECPNASECLKFARARWPESGITLDLVDNNTDPDFDGEVIEWSCTIGFSCGPNYDGAHPDDPDMAARLALAAALEAQKEQA